MSTHAVTKVSPIRRGNSSPKKRTITNMAASAIGACCLGTTCLTCSGCIVGSAGCAKGTQACVKCLKQKATKKINEYTKTNNPNYDPHGKSKTIDRGTPDTRIVRNKDIVNYIKTQIDDKRWIAANLNNINEIFELSEGYRGPYYIFKIHDKPDIDNKIKAMNDKYKKIVGGRKTIKRTNTRKHANKKKRQTMRN